LTGIGDALNDSHAGSIRRKHGERKDFNR